MKVEYGWLDYYAAATATLAILFTLIKLVRDLRNSKERVKIKLEYHIFLKRLTTFDNGQKACYDRPGFIVSIINHGEKLVHLHKMTYANGKGRWNAGWSFNRKAAEVRHLGLGDGTPKELPIDRTMFSSFYLAFPEFYKLKFVKVQFDVITESGRKISKKCWLFIRPKDYVIHNLEDCGT